jgi:hypothetical protein
MPEKTSVICRRRTLSSRQPFSHPPGAARNRSENIATLSSRLIDRHPQCARLCRLLVQSCRLRRLVERPLLKGPQKPARPPVLAALPPLSLQPLRQSREHHQPLRPWPVPRVQVDVAGTALRGKNPGPSSRRSRRRARWSRGDRWSRRSASRGKSKRSRGIGPKTRAAASVVATRHFDHCPARLRSRCARPSGGDAGLRR